ncbi:Universal stress protein family protein [Roseovarius sp. THAF9]|uniref:universal stress protein n=1 Tax=Roseovarius sp. THAF9 TaxID=2587847 RepID=UPI001267B382|nr:universal stress protein [Roseovarius sp. THAF9]QFT94422.1 Universal stress protein family protein [Roseovarius sp. THAF9]
MAYDSIHSIMLPVRGDGKGDNVFAHAAALARRFGARVRVVHCHPKTEDMMPYGVVIPTMLRRQIEDAAHANADVTRDQLYGEFEKQAKKLGLEIADHEMDKPTTRFIEYEGKQVDAVQRYGRLCDIVCVAKPDQKMNLGVNTLKSALFSSGRPVMMCPDNDVSDAGFADHVAIGWNGSLEATRAVAMAMPLISSAKKVTILHTGDSPKDEHPGADQLQRYLELRGVASEIRLFKAEGRNVGRQLLSETRAAGAGMLIIGAYHDSYERESLFGGNSQVVVAEADFPVVMVH